MTSHDVCWGANILLLLMGGWDTYFDWMHARDSRRKS
jgi:hypothetical protein